MDTETPHREPSKPLAVAVLRYESSKELFALASQNYDDLPARHRVEQAAQEGVYWAPSLGERDFLPLVALAVGPAQLLKVLAGDLEDVDDGPCMADRGRRLSEIAAERRSLEIEEEELIRVAEAGGQRVTRRPDADPSIVMAETLPWEAR